MALNAEKKARLTASLALEKIADNVKVLDLRGLTTFAAFFVIGGAQSTQQVKAIADNIRRGLKDQGESPLGIEGTQEAQWILMDYDDVIVHVFENETRDYYELERLWLDAPELSLDEDKNSVGR